MPTTSRRQFRLPAPRPRWRCRPQPAPALAAMGPNDKFDLLVKGGEVLDPSQNLTGQARHRHPLRRDRGARGRHPGRRRQRVLNAAGKLVTPGLIDLHAHVFPYGSAHRHSRRRARALPGHDHRWSRPATRAPTTSRPSAGHRRPDPRRASTPSCTSPTSGLPASRCPSSTTSTTRRPRPRPRPWPRTPTSCSASRCA